MFQKILVQKYLKNQNAAQLTAAWRRYTAYFHNPEIQENIRNLTEEQYQGEFVAKLFGEILGYTLNPEPNFNCLREQKNVKNAKSADAALLVDGEVWAVVELKDTNTTDLSRIETQAFGYKNNHRNARFVVISNFERLRFYIENVLDFIEFPLFTLTFEDFSLLYLCLAQPNFCSGVPARLQSESVSAEVSITEKLYADYSAFKQALFTNVCEQNSEYDKLMLFKKTQKLLDRFLFIFFAEDRGLIPANTMQKIIDEWKRLADLDEEMPLYARIQKYFRYLNSGKQFSNGESIFAYNGGLFKPDELLDSLRIDDRILAEHTLRLADYDFDSEVDVNILGHIFEHSLSEMEEVSAALTASPTEAPPLSKRKRDGVFYTPRYITSYIVENTLGRLCDEKKASIGLNLDLDETSLKKKKYQSEQLAKINEYRTFLIDLKICDPACGSGAFLNQALDFLLAEHSMLDLRYAKLLGHTLVFEEVAPQILENNLFGVDINEESVEIAKLSLWLRTARPGRKLNNLNHNIKCGNSLISDPSVDPLKAFDWQKEFPKVFEKGGFDVVIGNPPYVQFQAMGEWSQKYAQCGFETYNRSADLYCIFTERGFSLLRDGGFQSFIMPNKWMITSYGKQLRQFMAKTGIQQILNFGDVQFFADAATIVCIFVTSKRPKPQNVQVLSINKKTFDGDFVRTLREERFEYPADAFGEDEWSVQPKAHFQILQKMKSNSTALLKDLPIAINYGLKTGFNDAFFIDSQTRERLIQEDPKSAEIIRPLLRGRDIIPYGISYADLWLINPHNGNKGLNIPPINIDEYPAVKKHLDTFYEALEKRYDKGDTPYNLRNCAYLEEFSKPKIIYPNMTSVFPFMFDDEGFVTNQKCFIMTAKGSISLPYLTAVFNSSLAKLWIWYNCPELLGGTREISKIYFEKFPVVLAENCTPLAEKAEERSEKTKTLQKLIARFLHRLRDNLGLSKTSAALEQFYTLEFGAFVKELKKLKISLTLRQQDEWESYFKEYQTECIQLNIEIKTIDTLINQEVFKLYGLTPEEIQLVEF